jgi:hypothetical protein
VRQTGQLLRFARWLALT